MLYLACLAVLVFVVLVASSGHATIPHVPGRAVSIRRVSWRRYRVAVSTMPAWHPAMPAKGPAYQYAARRGLAAVTYVRGDVTRAHRAAMRLMDVASL